MKAITSDSHAAAVLRNAAARRGDPATSHVAVDDLTASGRRLSQADQILAAVRLTPGLTAGELAERVGLRRGTPAAIKRLNDLRLAGLVEKRTSRRCSVDGSLQLTWAAPGAPEQLELPLS